jgi:hypothetical protein
MYQTLAEHNAAQSDDSRYILRRFGPNVLAKNEQVISKFLFASAATKVELDQEIAACNEDV